MAAELQVAAATNDEALRCAAWSRAVGLDPVGTAPPTTVFVLVEHPLPWPSDVLDDPMLAAVDRAARDAAGPDEPVRVQAIVADGGCSERAVVVLRATRPFIGYGRSEAVASPEDLPAVVAALIGEPQTDPPAAGVTDVLVCTHGTRDVCCGSTGTRLVRELDLNGVNVWRTSHTGGHRFAPTAITFPDGTYWAHLEPGLIGGIIDRSVDAKVAAGHMRGCAAFGVVEQVADRAMFAEVGWSWLSYARWANVSADHVVEVGFEAPCGCSSTYRVALAEGREMPMPGCPVDPGSLAESRTELIVRSIECMG